jgi:5-methylcytosine-specific restriction enzyme B
MAFQLIALLGDNKIGSRIDPIDLISRTPYMQLDSAATNVVQSGIKVIWDIVQFHPSYGYEDFISGIEAESKNGELKFDRRDRIFIQMAEAARGNPSIKYVLIIDEINRGILGRIFGELILTLEYRNLGVRLLGQDRRISIPDNLYIIGTMNTADRNISLVDHALRRRFLIVPCLPDSALLENFLNGNSALNTPKLIVGIFQAIQEAFFREDSQEYERDQRGYYMGDYAIGHTYFMANDIEEFWTNMRFQVIPLMDEYRKEGILTDEHLMRTAKNILRMKLDPNQNKNVSSLLDWCKRIGDYYPSSQSLDE